MAKTTKGRVSIPSNIEEHLALAKKVYEKHKLDGQTSLLKNIEGMNWDEMGEKIKLCLEKHLEAEELKRKMEECYRERDNFFPEIQEITRVSKSLLKASFPKNPKKMGDWGFVVDDSPKIKVKKDV